MLTDIPCFIFYCSVNSAALVGDRLSELHKYLP
jgi:hypothetical protein